MPGRRPRQLLFVRNERSFSQAAHRSSATMTNDVRGADVLEPAESAV